MFRVLVQYPRVEKQAQRPSTAETVPDATEAADAVWAALESGAQLVSVERE